MERKHFFSHPFDMSEYTYGLRFVVGGLDLDLKETPAPRKETRATQFHPAEDDLDKDSPIYEE